LDEHIVSEIVGGWKHLPDLCTEVDPGLHLRVPLPRLHQVSRLPLAPAQQGLLDQVPIQKSDENPVSYLQSLTTSN